MRTQGSGSELRIFARVRVCSNTQDFGTCKRSASCEGVSRSAGSEAYAGDWLVSVPSLLSGAIPLYGLF